MATTPEGKVKNKVKKVLDKYKPDLYVRMNVPGGYGSQGLDYEGAMLGLAFAVEAKKPGGVLSARQDVTIQQMLHAGIQVFVVEDDSGCRLLDAWLTVVQQQRGLR